MIYIYQIDGVATSIYNKPRIQLSSRDRIAIFQYTARNLTLSFLDSVVITDTSRLKIYQESAIAGNLIWTGDIDWLSRKYDSKTNKVEVTFLPDVAKLKITDIVGAFNDKEFPDVLDYIVLTLGAGWSWESAMTLDSIYKLSEYSAVMQGYPTPNDLGSELVADCFYTDDAGIDDPYVKFWHEPTSSYLYSKIIQGGLQSGISSISGYSRVDSPHDVETPLSGSVGYGINNEGNVFLDYQTYYVDSGEIMAYGPGPDNLIINKFTVNYDSGANLIINDICQLADAYFYVLDKTIHFIHRHVASPKEISAKVISRKTRYSTVDFTLNLSVDYGLSSTELDLLDEYYTDHYSVNRTVDALILIQTDGRILPGDTLVLNGVEEGTVSGVKPGSDRVTVELDRIRVD